jgi:putative phosphonate catabolism associated alcohol dehydrogenase
MSNPSPGFPPGKAAIFNGQGKPFEFITRQVPPIKPGEILVRTLYTTLCGSDIHTYCGRRLEPPHVVLGHEIVGEVIWIDPSHSGKDFRGQPLAIGDRVTWSIFSVPEGVAAPRADLPQKSPRLFKYGHVLAEGENVFNGGLADYCVLRANTAVIRIPGSVPLKVAATINCAHATVMGALRVAGDVRGKRVLVFGAGLLGLSCLSMCREAGAAKVGVIDNDATRLPWGLRFGADSTWVPPAEATAGPFAWGEADVVFDMSGHPQAMATGLDSLSIGGCAIWIGAVYPAKPVPVDAQMVVRKVLQIRGLHNYNYEDFVNATSFIERNHSKYPFAEVIEKEYVLDDIEAAFAYAADRRPVRVGIRLG